MAYLSNTFFTALIIIGDLVSVMFSFLGGDYTIRFILKALAVLLVSGVIFGYYLDDVRRNHSAGFAKYVAGGVAFIVVVMIIGAFFIIGSPQTARLSQFDQQRVYDLQNIQGQIVNYWQYKGALPNDLSALNDSISSYSVPRDPETNLPYEYYVKNASALTFELCGTFKTDTLETGSLRAVQAPKGYDIYSQSFDHGVGRVCFERTIDKQLYPPLNIGK